jgi:atypical dual specificity phosphatase
MGMGGNETTGSPGSADEDGTEVLVRPLGYVEDEPVVRPVGDRNLYLGNALAADSRHHDRTFEHVLSVRREACPLTTHHHPLDDGPETDWPEFERAVDAARRLSRRAGSLLVHCTGGISRSTTILATMLAAEEDVEFRDALAVVQNARPFAMPHPALHELAVVYLAARR